MGEWQPIGTAPRDGTDVLLWRVNKNGRQLPPVVAGSDPDNWGEGWFAEDDADTAISGTPTHWMPTPAPPEPTT